MAKQIKAKKKLAHKRTLGSVISFELAPQTVVLWKQK